MKRENFEIKCSNGEIAVKHKWNAALKHVEFMLATIANNEQQNYRLIETYSVKDNFEHVQGLRTWKADNGTIIKFSINKT